MLGLTPKRYVGPENSADSHVDNSNSNEGSREATGDNDRGDHISTSPENNPVCQM